MKTIHYILIAVAVAIIILGFLYWDKIVAFFNKSKEGDKCHVPNPEDGSYAGGLPLDGIMENGVCVPTAKALTEGSHCITSDNKNGTITNGICIASVKPSTSVPPSSSSNALEVSNPNGAFLYYQSDSISGGKQYSKSNLLVPFGTKLTLVKVWQTNTSNQPFGGYYETTYNPYVTQNGFFDIKDIKKA